MEDLFNIPRRFKDVSLETSELLDPEIVQLGRDFIDKYTKSERNMVISGNAGRGKTHFTWCLYKGLVERFHVTEPFKVIKAKLLDDKILDDTCKWGSSTYFLNSLKEVRILFIDDFGIDRGTERMERDYYDLLDGRWEEELATVITTNLTPAQIERAYGQRIFSRLKDFKWINFLGNDLRGKQHEKI